MGRHSDNEPSAASLSQHWLLSDLTMSDWLAGSKSHPADSHSEDPERTNKNEIIHEP